MTDNLPNFDLHGTLYGEVLEQLLDCLGHRIGIDEAEEIASLVVERVNSKLEEDYE